MPPTAEELKALAEAKAKEAEKESPENQDANGSGEQEHGTLTQAKVDNLIGSARTQGRDTGRKSVFDELGVGDLDELKEIIEAKKTLEAEKMNELERMTAKSDELAAELEKSRQESEALQAGNLLRDKKDAIRIEAAKDEHRILPEAVSNIWLLIIGAGLQDEITVKDDALVGMENVLKKIIEAHPYIVATNNGKGLPMRNGKQLNKNITETKTKPRRRISF